jgi:hypothetical protein
MATILLVVDRVAGSIVFGDSFRLPGSWVPAARHRGRRGGRNWDLFGAGHMYADCLALHAAWNYRRMGGRPPLREPDKKPAGVGVHVDAVAPGGSRRALGDIVVLGTGRRVNTPARTHLSAFISMWKGGATPRRPGSLSTKRRRPWTACGPPILGPPPEACIASQLKAR